MRDYLPQSRRSRTRPIAVISAAGIAGVCAAGLIPQQAVGQANGPIGQQVEQAADDLARANAKVNKVTAELSGAQAQLDEAQARLDAAMARGAEADETAARALAAVAKAEAEVAEFEKQIEVTRARVSELRAEIGLLARQIYTSGGEFDELQIVLDSRDPAEFAERLAAIGRVSRGNAQVLDRLAVVKAELDEQLARSVELQEQADARRLEAAAKAEQAAQATQESRVARAEVAMLVAKKKQIVAKANSERGSVAGQYEELKAEQRRIAAKIRAALEKERREEARRRREEAKKRRPSGSPSSPDKPSSPSRPSRPTGKPGALAWPVPGYSVGGRTGPRVHPIYGYSSCHTGDDVGAPYGTPIRSVASGYVISTDYGGPYGMHTVISHGGGMSSMYAHQSSFNVSAGDQVRRGQVIGYVGSTGYSTGPHLHFEIHIDGVPWEPMGWFGGSKYRVSCA